MLKTAKNIIIGGGIAGLTTAYHLMKAGESVAVIEADTIGCRASSKAAGMVTPASEVHLGENHLMDCFMDSCHYYKSFIEELCSGKPEEVDFNRSGSLMCALDHDGQAELTRLKDFQQSMGLNLEELTKNQVLELEPHLSHNIRYAIYAKNEAYVDNWLLLEKLKTVLLDGGVQVIEHQPLQKVSFEGSQVKEITVGKTELTTLKPERLIITTGLDLIPDLQTRLNWPLRAVKGQVITLQAPEQVLSRPVRIYHRYPIYLVPRKDGRILVGATSEEFSDEDSTAGGVMDLLYASWRALPAIYDYPLLDTTAGLRPATKDHHPIIGKTQVEGLYVLSGLYRHGIMAAPYLSQQLANLILGEDTKLEWDMFSLDRETL
jgi:glycine oxidase